MEPVITPAQMTQIDLLAPDFGAATETLMQNAGYAVAAAIRLRFPPCRVLVLAGPGNNGGDGYVSARVLKNWGWPIAVAAIAPPRPGSDAAVAASRWHGPLVKPERERVCRADLVIDAVYGAGLSRDISPELAELLSEAPCLVAVDIPSGIDGTTGGVRGFAAQADLTVTFEALKPGHLLYPGRGYCGEIVCADIGIPSAAISKIAIKTWRNTPTLWHLPLRQSTDHKYKRGALTICIGAMAGAALLAAEAARRVGAGLVAVAGPPPAIGAPAGVLFFSQGIRELLEDNRRQTWLCGPGLGIDRAAVELAQLLAAKRTVIADADALTACADAPERLRGVAVITPHIGEFARIFPALTGDKLAAARAAAAAIGSVVVLKGADTIIAAPDGRAAINDNAPSTLATAGTGDILAGIIAGLIAQNMTPFDAACAGVWLHGATATIGPQNLIAEDLAPLLQRVVADPARFDLKISRR